MTRLSPVPKFGDWDSNGQGFTLIFDNARAQKNGKILNPNDPSFFSHSDEDEQDQPLRDEKVVSLKQETSSLELKHASPPCPDPVSNSKYNQKDHGYINPKVEKSASNLKSSQVPASPRQVYNRTYNKKDYEYITSFPRPLQAGWKATKNEAGVWPQRRDSVSEESDSFASTISTGSSTRSAESTGKYYGLNSPIYLMQMEKYQQQLYDQIGSDIADIHIPDSPELEKGPKENKVPPQSPLQYQAHQERPDHTAGKSSPARKMSVEVGAPEGFQRSTTPAESPAGLPKFGDWDTEDPGSAHQYTAIFSQIRDEKRSGGTPTCPSPLRPEAPGGNPNLPKTSQHAIVRRRKSSKWILCFGKSAVEE